VGGIYRELYEIGKRSTTNHTNQLERRQDMCWKFVVFVWFVV